MSEAELVTSVRQAAAVCDVSPPVVGRWISLGLIPGPPWTEQQLHKGVAGIPGLLLHGWLDLSGPEINAWGLSRVWPDARLRIFGGSGHKGNDAMVEELIRALDAFARV